MKTGVLVFYAGLLHSEYPAAVPGWPTLANVGAEIYNGAYVYVISKLSWSYWLDPGWYRADKVPVLEADVPKELLVMKLLLT